MKSLKRVFIFLLFGIIGYAGPLADFSKEFVCDTYSVRSAEFDAANSMNRLMFVEYKYTNKSLKLIDIYYYRLSKRGKREINELKNYLTKRRGILDDIVGVNKDITFSSLSLLHNVYKDNNIGTAIDIFNIYGLNQQKIRNLGQLVDQVDKKIKYKILDFAKIDSRINSMSCN
jgi:hypothetical protein